MREIAIDETVEKELLKGIKTSLIYTGVEILEYTQRDNVEYLKLDFPFTTTGNILTYTYNRQKDILTLLDASIYSADAAKMKESNAFVDEHTIKKIFDYCQEQTDALEKEETSESKNTHTRKKKIRKGENNESDTDRIK